MTTSPDSRNATEAGGTRGSLHPRVPSPGWGRLQVSVDADMRLCESCYFVWLQADESGAEGEMIDGSGHILVAVWNANHRGEVASRISAL